MHPYVYSNTLIPFYLFLYLHLDLICIKEELKSVGGFRFRQLNLYTNTPAELVPEVWYELGAPIGYNSLWNPNMSYHVQ
jgi:hypothetical protein